MIFEFLDNSFESAFPQHLSHAKFEVVIVSISVYFSGIQT